MERPFQEIGRDTAMAVAFRAIPAENGMTAAFIGSWASALTVRVTPGSYPFWGCCAWLGFFRAIAA